MPPSDLYDDHVTEILDAAFARGYEIAFQACDGGCEAVYAARGAAGGQSAFGTTRTEAAERALAEILALPAAA
jgi:hypothetical protein